MAANDRIPRRQESYARRMVKRLRDRSEINLFYKYILFFTNFIFMLVGIALAAAGTYILVLKEKKVKYFIEFLFDPSCLMCLGGCIMFVSSFLGCSGALRENLILLKIYYWVLSILLLLQVIFVVFVFIFYFMEDVAKKMKIYPEDVLKDAIIKYREDVDMRNFIDGMQEFLGCCGVSNDNKGYKDWNLNQYFNCNVADPVGEQCSVPYSCCIITAGENINYQCGYDALKVDEPPKLAGQINTRGCLFAIKELITEHAWTFGGVVIGFLIPQAFFICMAKTLYDQVTMQMSKW